MVSTLSEISKQAIKPFLNLCKREIKKGNYDFIRTRLVKVNGKYISARKALVDIGIFKEREIWKYILNLEEKDCIDVSNDYDSKRDFNTEMYEFIIYINGKKVYIKLTYRNKVVCLSFHESNY